MYDLSTIETYLAAEMRRKRIPGLSLAIVKDRQTVFKQHYGLANVELNAPVTHDTVYEIGSITKSFTALAVMLLAEDGRLRLDDPLSRFHPGLPAAWAAISIRHLLTSTAGVENWTLDWNRSDITPAVVAASIFDPPLLFVPGSRFYYTDVNFNLLGMLIWRLTGMTYDVFLQQRVLGPLGMSATRHNNFRALIPQRATGYDRDGDVLVNSDRIRWYNINLSPDVPANGANGSLLSTLDDLLKWEAEWTRPSLLPPARMAEMTTPARLNDGGLIPYGFGCGVETYAGRKLVAFGGGTLGFTTAVANFVDDGLAVIILTNQDSKPWDMVKEVARLFEPALFEPSLAT
jgi:CubicO group peptidase (beta-lactamase class C family)